jgi:hypothetical protein
MPEFKELVKNLYTSKNRELTEDKLEYIETNYKGKEEDFVKNFYATIGEELPEEKFNYIKETYLKKKEPTAPLSFGYETATEATSSAGLPKQEKLSQSPLKTAGTTTPSVSISKPKQNIDYLTDINNLYKEKVSASQGRVDLKKQLSQLQPQIETAYADIERLNTLYNDANLPIQDRNLAAKQANDLIAQITPIKQQYDALSGDYNNLIAKDRDILLKLKQVDNERQKSLSKDFSIGKDFIEKTGKGFVDAAAGVAGIFNTLGLSGDPESPEIQEEVKKQTRQNIDKIRDFGNKLVTQEAPKEFEKAFEGKMTPKKLLYLTSSAVSQTVPTVAAGLFTGGAGTALVGAGMGFNESKDIFKEAGLNDNQAEWAALGLSIPLGALESYGVDDVVKVISNPIVKKKVAAELAKNLAGKKITKELLFNESRKSLGKVIAQNAGGILTTGLKEGSTEMFQGALQEVAKQTAQEYTGVNPDDEMPFDEYIKGVGMDLAEQGAGGILGGTALQSGGQLISGAARGFKTDFTPSVYSQVKEFENPEKFAEFEVDLQEDIANGLITTEQADEAIQNVKSIQEADAKIPSTITNNEQRTKAVNLIIEKNNIEKEIEGKDKSLILPQTERLKEIDNELATISKGETTTDEQRGIEEPISGRTDVLEEGVGMAVEPSEEGIAGENIQAEEILAAPTAEATIIVPKVSESKTMDDFDTFKDAVAYNVKRTADIGIDESEANYGDAKNINKIKSDLEKAGIQVEKVSESSMSDGNYASFDGDKIKVTDENIPLQVLLHEIGEKVILDLDKAKQKIEHANNIFEAVTTYGASRGNDAFADNFYLYFLSPQTLKDLSPNVYAELDKLIPQNIKDLGKSLLSKYGVTEQILKYNKPTAEAKPLAEQIADLRTKEQAEYDAIDPNDKVGRKKIYDKYDKLITPLLEEQKAVEKTPTETKEVVSEGVPVKETAKLEPEVEVVEEEQYEPITVSGTSHDTFTKDNAVDYEEDEKEGDNGRTYTYLSSITVELVDDFSGETIGRITKLKDEDGEITWRSEDIDGNEIDDNLSSKSDAQKSIVDKWNKEQEKEFKKEKAKAAKEKAKEAEKAKKKAEKEAAKEAAKKEAKKTKPEQIGEGLLDVLGLAPEGEVEVEVKFSKKTGEPQVLTPTEDKEQQVVDQMNKMNLVNEGIDLASPSTTTEEINVNELNSRLDKPLKTVEWTEYKGVPFTFTISDQLRTGDVINPNTKENITNLKGGIGFNGTKGNDNNAWANTTKEEAESMLQRAKDVYANNKPLFDKLWKEGKLPNGHIPMAVVKMAETSILSNEAVFRVGIQNIETLPKINRKNAVFELAKSMQAKIDTESASLKRGVDKNGKPYTENTIKLKKKAINQYQKILDSINENKYDDIVDVLKDKDNFSLPEKSLIANEVFYGSPTPIGGKEIDISRSRPSTPVSKTLLGNANPALINLGKITDLITEPSMKNVPNMHIISIVGVDIKATEVNKINHPNYPYGVKGVSIGVLKNPVHMKDAFGEAYGSALGQVVKNEAANSSVSVKSALTQGIPVQSGLPNRVFKSAIAQGALDSVDKLAGFLRQAFPNTTFFTSNEAWDAAMADPSIKKKLKDGDVVYAFTTDGNIFINPSLKTTKATLHETGHIWMGFVKENNPELHAKGLELVTGTKEHQKAIQEYGDTELAREEALMELMSSKGDTIVNASQKAKFKEWLLSVYKYIADNFKSLLGLSPKEIENLTLDKFLEGMLADVLSGKELTTKKIKGEVKFSRESQTAKIKDYIESKRKAGESDKNIRAGIELVADKLGLTKEDINDLMSIEEKPKKGYTPKKKKEEGKAGEVKQRAFATSSEARGGISSESIPDNIKNYTTTSVEEQVKIAKDLIERVGVDNAITLLTDERYRGEIDIRNIPVLASELLKSIYKIQNSTNDESVIKSYANDANAILQATVVAAGNSATLMSMMREFYNSNPYNYVAQVTTLIKRNNAPLASKIIEAVNNVNNANKQVASEVASKVAKKVSSTKLSEAKERYNKSKANLKAIWNKGLNVGISANKYEQAKNDVQFVKALAVMAKDFVVYQSVKFDEFLKEVADQLGIKESEIDQSHLKNIFNKAKSEKISSEVKVGLKELELKLKDLIESHYTTSNSIEDSLVEKLKDQFGLNDTDAAEVEKAIRYEVKVLTAKEKIKALNAQGIKNKEYIDELLALSEVGLLDSGEILKTFGKKLGIQELTKEEADKLLAMAKEVQESKEDRIIAKNIQKFEDYKFVLSKKYGISDFLISNYLTNIFGSVGANLMNIANNVSESVLLTSELLSNALTKGNPSDIKLALKALYEGSARGFDFTKEVLKTGVASYKEPQNIHARNMWELIMDREVNLTGIERWLQKLFKTPYIGNVLLNERRFWNRALLSMDSLSGTTNLELGALWKATKEANRKGLKGKERSNFIAEQMASTPAIKEEAVAYAISLGYKEGTKAFRRAVANYLVSKRPEAIKEAATSYSSRATLTQEPPLNTITGQVANILNKAIAKNQKLKFIFPVVNTFANLVVKNIERSPFEFFSLGLDVAINKAGGEYTEAGLTEEEIARRLKAATVSTAVAVLLFMLAGGMDDEEGEFEIYGSGTGDPKLDNERKALGWKPNTIRFSKDGGYYNFEFLPVGFLLSMVGNMRDYFKYKDEEAINIRKAQSEKLFGKTLDSLTTEERNTLESELLSGKYNVSEVESKELANAAWQLGKTPIEYSAQLFKSLGDLMGIIGDNKSPKQKGISFGANIVRGNIAPRYLGEVRDIFDPKLYDSKEFWNTAAANIPFIKLGNVKLDGFGRDIEKYEPKSVWSGLKYAVTRRFYNPSRGTEVDQFLWENRISVGPPNNSARMAYPEEYYRKYIVLRGQIAMGAIQEAIKNKSFEYEEDGVIKEYTPQQKAIMINEILSKANELAGLEIDNELGRNNIIIE